MKSANPAVAGWAAAADELERAVREGPLEDLPACRAAAVRIDSIAAIRLGLHSTSSHGHRVVAGDLLGLQVAAERAGVAPRTLRRLAAAGAVVSLRVGRSLRFRPADLDRAIAKGLPGRTALPRRGRPTGGGEASTSSRRAAAGAGSSLAAPGPEHGG